MQEKIAATDFAIIENILRKHITSSMLEAQKWVYIKILNDPTVYPDYDRKEARRILDELNQRDDKDDGIEKIIPVLRARQELRRKFKLN